MLLSVPEMTCNHCVMRIERAVRAVHPQATVVADVDARTVHIEAALPVERAIAVLAEAGYAASPAESAAAASGDAACCGHCTV